MQPSTVMWIPCRAVITALCVYANAIAMADGGEQRTFGWVEKISIEPWGTEVKAKLDSGALTSSMQAEDIEKFRRDGDEWVRFVIAVTDEASDDVVAETFERPVFDRVLLRGAGGEDRRVSVLMAVCIADAVYQAEFTLENRDGMNYPVLLGRRVIQHLGTIDVTGTFLHEPDCDQGSPVLKIAEKS